MPRFNFSGKPPILPTVLLLGGTLLTFAIYKDYNFDVTIKPTSISIVGQPGNLRLPPTSDR
jgi:hypothetical protein